MRPSHCRSDDQGNDSRDRWLFYCHHKTWWSKVSGETCPKNLSIVMTGRCSITANVHIKRRNTLSQLCYCSADFPLFLPLSCCTDFLVLANISLSLITPTPPQSPSLSPADCLYLSSHPPWCFSPSLQSMWLLRCLSICSPRQAQRAGATLWLLGQ